MSHRPSTPHVALQALLFEARQHQETVQRTLANINLLGIGGPLVAALMLMAILGSQSGPGVARGVALVVTLMGLGGLLLHFNWIELLEQTRYKYASLYPRIAAHVGHPEWNNYIEYTSPRALSSQVPALFYNVVASVALFGLWLGWVVPPGFSPLRPVAERDFLAMVSGTAIGTTLLTAIVVLIAARKLERDVKLAQGRIWPMLHPFMTPLKLVPLIDGERFRVDLVFEVAVSRRSGEAIVVRIPEGFLTDLASVPKILWPLFPPWDRYGPGAVVHDFLYSREAPAWKRSDADRVLLDLMKSLGVGFFVRWCVYLAVRMCGGPAFQDRPASRGLNADQVKTSAA